MANTERTPSTPKNLEEFNPKHPTTPEKALSSGYPELKTTTAQSSQFEAPRQTRTPRPTYTAWGPEDMTYGWGEPQ